MRDLSSICDPVRKFGGGAYFLLEEGFSGILSIILVPKIRSLEKVEAEKFWLSRGEDMYRLIDDLQVLRFLEEPLTEASIFEAAFC